MQKKNICEPLTLITWEIWFQNTIFKLKQKMHRYISTILTWTPPLRLKSNCKLIQVPLQGSYQMENDCKIHTRQHHQQLKHQTDKGILQNKGTLISREHFQTWKRISSKETSKVYVPLLVDFHIKCRTGKQVGAGYFLQQKCNVKLIF
jgi:hypothetical protein